MPASPAQGVVYMTIRKHERTRKVAVAKVTKNYPAKQKVGDVVFKLRLHVPDPVFRWLLAADDDASLLEHVEGVEVAQA